MKVLFKIRKYAPNLLAGLFVCVASTKGEEGAQPALPAGPWPARAPAMASWTVSVEWSQKETSTGTQPPPVIAPKKTLVSTTVVTKTWPVVHEVQTYNKDSKILDKWYANNMEAIIYSDSQQVQISNPAGEMGNIYQDYSRIDFRDFEWLSRGNYKGIQQIRGHKCFAFEGRVGTQVGRTAREVPANTPDLSSYGTSFNVKACIDSKTLLPVELDYGDEIRTYDYGNPPTNVQSLPPVVLSTLQAQKQRQQMRSVQPEKP